MFLALLQWFQPDFAGPDAAGYGQRSMPTALPLTPAEASMVIATNRAIGFVAIRVTLLLLHSTGVLRTDAAYAADYNTD
jgi:hypothetical protein